MDLDVRLRDPSQAVRLYGTTPPRAGTPDAAVHAAADKLAARLQRLQLDGVVVYDIQDEPGRSGGPRPFPFAGTIDPRVYACALSQRLGVPAITYKSVGMLDAAGWEAWLDETADVYGIRYLSVVGRPVSAAGYPLTLAEALRRAAAHRAGFTLGAVAIAERHSEARSESARMLAKTLQGCRYFVSQTVYHADATRALLADYRRDCNGAGVDPCRLILTFAPVGREKTMAFLRWLGVRFPAEVEHALAQSAAPLQTSIEICRDNLQRILDQALAARVPVGINVESVSIYRDEIDASVELFHALAEVLRERTGTGGGHPQTERG